MLGSKPSSFFVLIRRPGGPEPALGEKKPGLSHFGREQASKTTKACVWLACLAVVVGLGPNRGLTVVFLGKTSTTKAFAQQARGSRDFL